MAVSEDRLEELRTLVDELRGELHDSPLGYRLDMLLEELDEYAVLADAVAVSG